MKRRNTMDSLHVNWPIIQYYYTHNNGSCDDILIQYNSTSFDTPRQIHHHNHQSIYSNRRRTFPLERLASQGLHYQQQQERRHSHKIEIVTPSPINRRESSSCRHQQQQQQQQQQRYKKKRETLANIISSISRSNSSILGSGNISLSMNNDDATTRMDSDLDIKWETIRQYNPQLDNEKILEQDSEDEDEGYSHDLTPQKRQRNGVAVVAEEKEEEDIHDDSNNSSSNDSNSLFLPAGQETEQNGTGSISIQMDAAAAATPKIELPAAAATTLVPMSNTVDPTDMFLFLFGFLFFPLWWIGTWRFFMQSDKAFLHKQQRGFQILNCCMALASLLLTGLIIGLVTVWA